MRIMEDNKLRLLTNRLPVMVGNIPVYSPLLLDIASVGMEKYHEYIGMCSIGVNSLSEKPEEDVEDFIVLMSFVLHQEGFYEKLVSALQFFTRLEFDIRSEENDICLFCGSIVLNASNYSDFMKAIKFVTCIKDDVPEDELDEFDKAILEAENKIAEEQGLDGGQIPLKDLISSVCNMEGNGLNVLNIWDINIFSFYEQMSRAQLKESYFLGIKQVLAGADPKEIDIEYYIKKTN